MPSKKKAKPTRANVAPPVAEPGIRQKNRQPPKTEHLKATQFKPGQSGNPSGRPKSPFTDAIRRLAEQIVKEDKQKRTYADLAVRGMYNEAIKGNVQAFSVLADRTEGKPMQAVQMSGPGGGAIQVESMSREEREKEIAVLLSKAGVKHKDEK